MLICFVDNFGDTYIDALGDTPGSGLKNSLDGSPETMWDAED